MQTATFQAELLEAIEQTVDLFLNRDLAESDVFARLLETAVALTGAQGGFIGRTISDEPSGKVVALQLTALPGAKASPRSLEYSIKSPSVLHRLLNTNEPRVVIIEKTGTQPEELPGFEQKIENMAGLPIAVHGRIVGILGFVNRPEGFPDGFFNGYRPIVSTLAVILEAVREQREADSAVQALQYNQEFLKNAGRMAMVGGWELLTGRDEINLTDEAARIFGIGSGETLTKSGMLNFYPEPHRDRLDRAIGRLINDGIEFSLELALKNRAGVDVWVRQQGKIAEIGSEGVKLHGAVQDITLQKDFEARQADSERNLEAIINSLNDVVFLFDEDGRVLQVWYSSKAELFSQKADHTGVMLEDVFMLQPELGRLIRRDIARVIESGETLERNFEDPIRGKGRHFYARLTLLTARYQNRKLVSMVIQDVTTRKKHELKLLKFQTSLRELNEITTGVQQTDPEVIDHILEIGANYLGLKAGVLLKLVGDRFHLSHHTDDPLIAGVADRKGIVQNQGLAGFVFGVGDIAFADKIEPEQTGLFSIIDKPLHCFIGISVKLYRPFGVLIYFSTEARSEPFGALDTEFMRIIAQAVSSTTERRRYEADLIEAKEEALRYAHAKEDFLSMMSHELRTPLNSIIGMAHVLANESPRDDQVKHLQTLLFSAESLLGIIDEILDFNKINQGKVQLDEVDFDLPALLNNVVRTFSYIAEEKGLELTLEVDENLARFVKGDPVRLGQVFNNLVGNALKFTSQGRVVLMARVVQGTSAKQTIYFAVKDTGVGIPAAKHKMIFNRFSQADGNIARHFGGTGLGLAITKGILELMKSRIQLVSKAGQGSLFHFELTFPLGKHGRLENPSPISLAAGLSTQVNILLVDDNIDNRVIARMFLKKAGIIPDEAESGPSAVRMAAEKEYDLIFMDLQMPGMDGYQTVREIREKTTKFNRTVPIIALTAEALADTREKVLAGNMNDYVAKPFNPKSLYDMIDRFTLRQISTDKG